MYLVPQFSFAHAMNNGQRGLKVRQCKIVILFKRSKLQADDVVIAKMLPVISKFFNMQVNDASRRL